MIKQTVPGWSATNETIASPLIGLDVQAGDSIAAVLGSGDIPFAMIAHGARVHAADFEEAQVIYARTKQEHIRKNDLDAFLHEGIVLHSDNTNSSTKIEDVQAREAYFSQKSVWESLVKHVDNLYIADPSDFLSYITGKTFDKIYASNAPGWGIVTQFSEFMMLRGEFECKEFFTRARESLHDDGLIYRTRYEHQYFFGQNYKGFIREDSLSQKALEAQKAQHPLDDVPWVIEVYRKTE